MSTEPKRYVMKPMSADARELPKGFEDDLNEAQLEAVRHTDGPLLVIAGAGSGKTRTLVYRLARLVSEGVTPESILLLTFTRKSAQEMMRRATNILDARCQKVAGGTFHSFANVILRQYSDVIGYPSSFTIMDRSDAEDLVGQVRRNTIGKNKRFPKKGTLLNVISKSINTSSPIGAILEKDYPQFFEFCEEIEKIQADYGVMKREMMVMDYDDLLINLGLLLRDHNDVRDILQNQFKFIMVDEYQDTNQIQAEIVFHLAGTKQNIMVVGDDSQSIYSFRGANFRNIIEFPQLFPNTKQVVIEENYRSRQPILDLTNAVISRAQEKYSKSLYSTLSGGDKPTYVETVSDNEQSRFVVQKILDLREEGVALNDMAVLFRSSSHANDIEVQLKAANIPYVKYGGFKFTETAHIKDVTALLRIIFNLTDGVSWMRLLLLLEGLGPKSAEAIYQHVVSHAHNLNAIPLDMFKKKRFYHDLESLLRLVVKGRMAPVASGSIVQLVDDVIEFYMPLLRIKYDDYHKRIQDLESLKLISERYQDLESFLSEISLEPPELSQTDSIPETQEDEQLILSTIHSAKGLEWHSVFVISMLDGFLPSFRSLGDLAQIEEERRLLYVAMTRAKENLFVIKPNMEPHGGQFYGNPGMGFSRLTRFLEEAGISGEYMDRMVLVEEGTVVDGDGDVPEIENLPSSGSRYSF